jgi:hypothetical protein
MEIQQASLRLRKGSNVMLALYTTRKLGAAARRALSYYIIRSKKLKKDGSRNKNHDAMGKKERVVWH